jgi:hypothetical protein
MPNEKWEAEYYRPPHVGDYVRTKRHGHTGRVTAVHHYCPEGAAWQMGQEPPLPEGVADGKWVSILCPNDGGAIVTFADDCELIEPFVLNNMYEAMYFGPGEPDADAQGRQQRIERHLDGAPQDVQGVVFLRHQRAVIGVEAVDEDDAWTAAFEKTTTPEGLAELATAEWETTLIEPVAIEGEEFPDLPPVGIDAEPFGACILVGADGENPDDCTTHDHEPYMDEA